MYTLLFCVLFVALSIFGYELGRWAGRLLTDAIDRRMR